MSMILNMTIEVTRRCNMHCNHCMRGDAQNKDFNSSVLLSLPKEYDEIKTLCFTGGEPFLVPRIIQECLEIFRLKKIKIQNIIIVTNESVYDNNIREMVNECVLNSFNVCNIYISNDDIKTTTKQLIDNHRAELLERRKIVIAMGKAIENHVFNCDREQWKDNCLKSGYVFVTVDGMITTVMDASFELEDANIVCSLDQLYLYYNFGSVIKFNLLSLERIIE